jgi:uncharacterized membrane protein (TIGR02234 family)
MRRELTSVLVLGAAGAGLVVFAVRQTWAQAVFTPPRPLPVQQVAVSGQQLVPLASALALAALACLAAVIATRSAARRVAGGLLAVLGAGAAAAAAGGAPAAAVLAAARGQGGGTLGGSTTSGTSPASGHAPVVIAGSAGHVLASAAPWPALAVLGAVVIVLAGLTTAWRGPRWPVMSARYERAPQSAAPGGDSATMWENLNRDLDPTVDGR